MEKKCTKCAHKIKAILNISGLESPIVKFFYYVGVHAPEV